MNKLFSGSNLDKPRRFIPDETVVLAAGFCPLKFQKKRER
jgi:hypothetical protein